MSTHTNGSSIEEVDALELSDRLAHGSIRLIDVREPDEFEAERIEGAENIPLGSLSAGSIGKADDRPPVLHCRTGVRSLEGAERLLGSGLDRPAHLAGGIRAWKRAGLPTRRGRRMIPIMRQVQITAGSLVLVGVALGLFAHPWFFALSAFIGAGLVFSGATGTCGMGAALSKMPWNSRSPAGAHSAQ